MTTYTIRDLRRKRQASFEEAQAEGLTQQITCSDEFLNGIEFFVASVASAHGLGGSQDMYTLLNEEGKPLSIDGAEDKTGGLHYVSKRGEAAGFVTSQIEIDEEPKETLNQRTSETCEARKHEGGYDFFFDWGVNMQQEHFPVAAGDEFFRGICWASKFFDVRLQDMQVSFLYRDGERIEDIFAHIATYGEVSDTAAQELPLPDDEEDEGEGDD